ncbi:MAG: RagB/SusD family nutrient uptake outer membrane protein [Candidatus Dadabacteria bacterium]
MKIYKAIYLFAAVCLVAGCTKILDKKDLSSVSEKDVWNDLPLATAYVNRIYARALPGWSTEWTNYSDESDGGGSYMYGQLTENSVNYWPYDDIREINVLLDNIDNGSLSQANRTLLKSQAYFFRAWQYFEMVKRYGGVPLILHAQELSEDLFVKRAPTSVTVQQIVTDLDSAIAGLPTFTATSGSNDGHLHKGTALAVKGRVLLYYASPQFDPSQSAAGRWQAAYTANKDAKDYLVSKGFGLYSSFSDLWFKEMNKEDIFVKRYDYSPLNSESRHTWSAATRPLDVSQGATGGNRPALEMVNAFPMKDGRAINDPNSIYKYDPKYYWQNRDPRFKQTIVYNGAVWGIGGAGPIPGRIQWTYVGGEQNNPTITGFYMRKAVDTTQSAIDAYNSSTDWVELRFAEVLLNLAEAANEVGKTDEAYVELKALRSRAGIDAGVDGMYGLQPGMDKTQMRQAVRLERQVELAFEGKRFWDLRRWRLFETLLNGTRRHGLTITLKIPKTEWDALRNSKSSQEMVNLLNQSYTTYFNDNVKLLDTQFDINWKPEYYFFGIPNTHIQRNSNLEQTKGWAGGTFDPLQ